MGKDKSEKKDRKEKKEKKEKKLSDDGVKKSKKEKKDKNELALVAVEQEVERVSNEEGDGKALVLAPVGALVPFANPLADDKQTKNVLKNIKKGELFLGKV